MQLVVARADAAAGGAKLLGEEQPSVSSPVRIGIKLREEVRVANVHLVGVDSHDRSVLLVQLDDLEDVLSSKHNVVVEFVPPCQRCQPRSRHLGERAKVQTPNRSI